MSLHIGKIIEEKVKEKKWTNRRFALEAGMTYRNTLYLFERNDISIVQLAHISKVLEFDFVKLFSTQEEVKNFVSEEQPFYNSKKNNIHVNLTIAGDLPSFENLPKLINSIKEQAMLYGLKIV